MKLTKRTLRLALKPMLTDRTEQLVQLSKQLIKFMQESGGIGLAANQVGLRDRCFVMGIEDQEWFCANPEVVNWGGDFVDFDEGCLSFPGDHCIISRPDTVEVRYQNTQGQWQHETLTGLASRCFQHELDHLNGISMWDRHKEQNAKQS
jgi:peptide deformylase